MYLHHATVQQKTFSVSPGIQLAIATRKQPLLAALKRNRKDRKWLASWLAAAIEISLDAAAVAVLSELHGIFVLKEQKRALKSFLRGEGVFRFAPDWL